MYRELLCSAALLMGGIVGGVAPPAMAQPAVVDTDRDGLSDEEEGRIGTSPVKPDTDGDGLLDSWEVGGLTRAGYFEPLHEYGADPLRKDVFVEIDWMETSSGSPVENARIAYNAAVDVTRVFERSGTDIRIHFDLGLDPDQYIPPEEVAPDLDFGLSDSDTGTIIPYRDAFPAKPGCEGLSGGLSLYSLYNSPRFFRPSRRNLFYYVALVEQARPPEAFAMPGERPNAFVDDFSDEAARRDGLRASGVHSIIIYRKPVAPDPPVILRHRYSSTLLHELGHAFGLGHGGALPNGRWDDTNRKVNYVSVMNYRYVFWGVELVENLRRMDFSHGRFGQPLREYELHEHFGMGALPNAHIRNNLLVSHLENSPFKANLDWNGDGRLSENVRHDLNGNGVIDNAVFTDHDDWGKFQRDGFDGIGTNAFRTCGLGCGRGENLLHIVADLNGSGPDDIALVDASSLAVAGARGDGSLEIDAAATARGRVDTWSLAGGDRVVVGDFVESKTDSLFLHRGYDAALLTFRDGRFALDWSARRQLNGTDSIWRLGPSDQVLGARLRPSKTALAITDGETVGIVARDDSTGDLRLIWQRLIRIRNDPEFFVIEPGRSMPDGTQSIFARSDANLFEITMPSDGEGGFQAIALRGLIAGTNRAPEGWRLTYADCVLPIDLDGDFEDEVVLFSTERLGVVDWVSDAPRLVWKAERRLATGDRRWTLGETRRMVHGRFDPTVGESIVMISDTRMATVAWNANDRRFDVVATQPLKNGPVNPWELHPTDRIVVGRFLPGDADQLLIQHDRGLTLLAYTRGEPPREAGFSQLHGIFGELGAWSFGPDDTMLTGNFDLDPEQEVLVRKGPLMAILQFHPEPYVSFLSQLDGESLTIAPARTFLRGDVDASLTVDLTDAVTLLSHLFVERVALNCTDSADVDDSGEVDLTDPINLLQFLFAGGGPPAPPGTVTPGIDPTLDSLDCD